ncbi:MAG TPA: MBOAT family O-acyltransferase [Bacteroidia bacterium]
MIFNSIPFLVFILCFFLGKKVIGSNIKLNWIWITAMSFFFYGWWDWRFLFLLVGTGTIDYFCGLKIAEGKAKKFFLYVSVISNIGSLALFKYGLWLARSLDQCFDGIIKTHFEDSIPAFTYILPVGISFYTFNSLSYALDLYKGKAKKAESWLHFMAFISFFPHLVAGPIIRARDILGQLNKKILVSETLWLNGLKTCLSGFFMKMVLADNLASLVNHHFTAKSAGADTLTWWLVMLAFTMQIYFDFNGYSSIARGIAKMCGIHFKLNFNHPYRAIGFGDFWSRWHISLSTFFRDYVYIPLGGNRKGKWRTELNRWITMLLSGLWHGAGLTFILWGALHAAFLSLENHLGFAKKYIKYFVFPLVLLAWVLFRSTDTDQAFDVYRHLFSFKFEGSIKEVLFSNGAVWLVFSFIYDSKWYNNLKLWRTKKVWIQGLIWAGVIAMTIYFRGPEQQFIYFQF